MSKLIEGVHHIAIKPTQEKYPETVEFYTKVLGMEVIRQWGDETYPCLMVSCGDNSCMEILMGEAEAPAVGPLNHLAFATSHVDELIERVRAAGYPIAVEPKDVDLGSMAARIGFCYGPIGEYLEFFWVK